MHAIAFERIPELIAIKKKFYSSKDFLYNPTEVEVARSDVMLNSRNAKNTSPLRHITSRYKRCLYFKIAVI
jgi:hypothetical protein